MENITIFRLTEEDLPDYFGHLWDYLCRDLFSDADTREEREYFRSAEYKNEVKSRLRGGSLLLLRYESGKIVLGFSQLLFENGGVRVMEFWLLPENRGKGLGKLCWRETEKRLQTLGISRITLEAATASAEKFWNKMGFTALKQESMEKSL